MFRARILLSLLAGQFGVAVALIVFLYIELRDVTPVASSLAWESVLISLWIIILLMPISIVLGDRVSRRIDMLLSELRQSNVSLVQKNVDLDQAVQLATLCVCGRNVLIEARLDQVVHFGVVTYDRQSTGD